MALTAVEEAQTRELLAQEAALLSLASSEPTIISKLGATKVNLSQLPTASSADDADLLLIRQGTDDRRMTALLLANYVQSKVSFAAGTRLPFAQAAAPAGWTQITNDEADNRMLRVVKTAGAGVGGTHSPILCNVVPSHTHNFTSGNASAGHTHGGTTLEASANHSHGIGDPGHNHLLRNNYSNVHPSGYINGPAGGNLGIGNQATDGNVTGVTVGGQDTQHTHVFTTGNMSENHTHSGATDNGSSSTNWQPRFIDLIICQKD